MPMTEEEARRLAAQIAREPGWHAEIHHNVWTGTWFVSAWPDALWDAEAGEPGDWYVLHYRSQWAALRQGLAAEQEGDDTP